MTHRLAPEAEAELDDIWYYTARASDSIEIADRVMLEFPRLLRSRTHALTRVGDLSDRYGTRPIPTIP